MQNLRGQATPGLLFGVGTVMIIFLSIFTFYISQQGTLDEKTEIIEKRNECLKNANLINSVYVNGPGTEVTTETDFLITTFNHSQISVEAIESINETPTAKIAFLASEAGATAYEFYVSVSEDLPDAHWYKTCFSDLGGSGCSWDDTAWMEENIPNDIEDLIENLDNYNTVYLEDPTMYYTLDYIEKLENWTKKGNALILSEHVMCREQSWGSYPTTAYRCNPSGYNNDEWDIFNITLNQRAYAWGWPEQYNVIVNDTNDAFDLTIGDQLSFEERPYISIESESASSEYYEAEDLDLNGGYSSTSSCTCSSPSSGRCARHRGRVGNEGTVSIDSVSESTGQYQVSVRYCDESDDNGDPDDYTLYLNNNPIHDWQSSDGYGSGQIWVDEELTLNLTNGDEIKVGGTRGSYSTQARIDFIDIQQVAQEEEEEGIGFKTIAKYRDSSELSDSRNEPAIAFWDYGKGRVFYFGDFQVDYINIPGKEFSQVLIDIISVAYSFIYTQEESEVTCYFSAFAPYQQVTGDIVIKNQDNFIVIENVNQTG